MSKKVKKIRSTKTVAGSSSLFKLCIRLYNSEILVLKELVMVIFNIKNIRLQKKISISKLSKITNISRTYIRDLENNKKLNPTLAILYSIANALDVNIKDLFYSKFDIENLKEEMYARIDKYGLNSAEVMEISHLIDFLINIEMQEK